MARRDPRLLEGVDCAAALADAAATGQREGAIELAQLLNRGQQVCLCLGIPPYLCCCCTLSRTSRRALLLPASSASTSAVCASGSGDDAESCRTVARYRMPKACDPRVCLSQEGTAELQR